MIHRRSGLPALALLVLLSVSPADAQLDALERSTAQQRADFQTDFMKQKLDMSPEQYEKIGKINSSVATEAEPILKSERSLFSKARQIRKLEAKREEKLRTVLSEQQFEDFIDSKAEMRDSMLEHFRSRSSRGSS